ncbi:MULTISPECIES: hypothetical protein [unclassified Flavobacterium]|uniref:hypothetical protein n=1 Tax=unclassified Flavobacterium TaxID=196869 RepID=UPI000F0C831C|nr:MULTISPECIES: hypothetical protein [unclassified Flavobacterium]AYN03375.1 hypothetical protein EAG11_03700 [Flavobacterium sp. 140616W15]MCD0476056.1 hypothetical protein [Flavobacterium sp. EDS]
MKTIDLSTINPYGLTEAILIEKKVTNEIVFKVKIFNTSFNKIVDWVPLHSNSNVNSLVYLLNTDLYFASEFTKINQLQEFFDQLLSINEHIDSTIIEEYNAIKQICESALQNGNSLFLKLDD